MKNYWTFNGVDTYKTLNEAKRNCNVIGHICHIVNGTITSVVEITAINKFSRPRKIAWYEL